MFGIKVAILSILVAGTVGWSNKGTPEGYPNCYVDYPEGVGDGHCSSFSPEHNVEACGWDGGYVLLVRSHKMFKVPMVLHARHFLSVLLAKTNLPHIHTLISAGPVVILVQNLATVTI